MMSLRCCDNTPGEPKKEKMKMADGKRYFSERVLNLDYALVTGISNRGRNAGYLSVKFEYIFLGFY